MCWQTWNIDYVQGLFATYVGNSIPLLSVSMLLPSVQSEYVMEDTSYMQGFCCHAPFAFSVWKTQMLYMFGLYLQCSGLFSFLQDSAIPCFVPIKSLVVACLSCSSSHSSQRCSFSLVIFHLGSNWAFEANQIAFKETVQLQLIICEADMP